MTPIKLPTSQVRLSAGRTAMSREAQVLCFLAGANSCFFGEELLVTGKPDVDADQKLLHDAGMKPAPLCRRSGRCPWRPL
jgi:biotin synthase